MSKKFFKILPLKASGAQRCGVCDELLVIPPIYSCKSVPFICGPCFEGYRYYLDDDELRAVDNPIRQMLYENFARNVRFPCAYYPHCMADMTFNSGARLHYKEFCFAKLLWIFRCPISRANRWFLRPDQLYCDWRYKRIDLFDDDNDKMMKHLRHLHSEYILEKPYVLKLRDLKNFERSRQLFLLLIEETDVIAVLMTEITSTDIVFRCRVNDYVETKTATHDPYECCIILNPPNERFTSIIDIKFECVRFDSNDVEYPWQALRLPLRHLIEETSFKIFVLPRSLMLRAMPYLHRDRQLLKAIEDGSSEATLTTPECGLSASDGTMSVEESDKTDIELLSLASSSSDKKSDEYTENSLDLCEIKLGDLEDISNFENWHCKRATHLVFLPNTTTELERTSGYKNLFKDEFDNTKFSFSTETSLELGSNVHSFPDSPEDLPQLIEVFPSEHSKKVIFGRIKKKSKVDNSEQLIETIRTDSREHCENYEQSENLPSHHPEDDQTIQSPERITSPLPNQQTDLLFDVSKCSSESSQLNSWTDSEINMLTLLSIPDGPTVPNSLHSLIDLITSKMITEECDKTANNPTLEESPSEHQTKTELVQEKAFNSIQLGNQIDVSKPSLDVHFISTAAKESKLPSISIPDYQYDETKKKAAVPEHASQEYPNEEGGSPSSNYTVDAKPLTATAIPSKDSRKENIHSLLSIPDIPAIGNSLHNLIGLISSLAQATQFIKKIEVSTQSSDVHSLRTAAKESTNNISSFENSANPSQNIENILLEDCSRHQQSTMLSPHQANKTDQIQAIATRFSDQIDNSKQSLDVCFISTAAKESKLPSISIPDDPPSTENSQLSNKQTSSEVNDETKRESIGHQKVNPWPLNDADRTDLSEAQLKKDEGYDEKKNGEGISDSEGILNCQTTLEEKKTSAISISIDDDPFEPKHSIPSEQLEKGDEQLNIGALQLVCSGLKEKREYSENENDSHQQEHGTESTAQKTAEHQIGTSNSVQIVEVDVSSNENTQEKAQEIIQRDKYASTTMTVMENENANRDCRIETNYYDEMNGTSQTYTSILDCLRSPEGN